MITSIESKLPRSHDAAMSQSIQQIESIIHELGGANRDAETQFLELGAGLQELYTKSQEMTTSAQHAANTVSADNHISEIITAIAEQILVQFNGVKAINLQILDTATSAADLLQKLDKSTPEIRKIDKELWILGSNMAIQSAGNSHTQTLFGEYSHELKQFSKNIKTIILEFQRDLKGMTDSIGDLQTSIRVEAKRLEELITQSQNNIRHATLQLEELLADSVTKIGVIETRSRLMSERVADVVTSIQFNDITRQQMEHVLEALEDGAKSNSPFELYRCMRIQSAQMSQVADTLQSAIRTISRSFEDMVECGASIASQYQTKMGAQKKEAPFSKIKNALHELDNLLEMSAVLRKKSTRSLESATVASNRLASHLHRISEITGDLNLQAINALVMSRNIGEGGASLVALSKEVHSLSKESTATVEEVVRILKAVGTQTTSLGNLMKEETQIDHAKQIKMGFDQIDEIGAQYFQSIAATTTLSHQLQQHAHEISKKSDFILTLGSRIQQGNRKLIETAEQLAEHAVPEDSSSINLKERYTMESERLIHDRVHQELTGSAFSDTSKIIEQPLARPDADEELGDFELF